MDRVMGRGLVWLVLCDTYLEHGGGFVVPVLSAIAALGRTTRNVKSAACTRGRNIETEHVEIMAIFSLSTTRFSAVPSVSGTTICASCAYDLPCLFPAVSYSDVYIAIRYYVTQARAKRHGSITLSLEVFYGKIARDENERKETDDADTKRQIFNGVSLSLSFYREPKSGLLDVTTVCMRVLYLFFRF